MVLRSFSNSSYLWHSPEFRTLLRHYIPIFISSGWVQNYTVTSDEAFTWRYNFDGFLLAKKYVAKELLWLAAALNGIHAQEDFNENFKTIIVPNPDRVSAIMATFTAGNKVL